MGIKIGIGISVRSHCRHTEHHALIARANRFDLGILVYFTFLASLDLFTPAQYQGTGCQRDHHTAGVTSKPLSCCRSDPGDHWRTSSSKCKAGRGDLAQRHDEAGLGGYLTGHGENLSARSMCRAPHRRPGRRIYPGAFRHRFEVNRYLGDFINVNVIGRPPCLI